MAELTMKKEFVFDAYIPRKMMVPADDVELLELKHGLRECKEFNAVEVLKRPNGTGWMLRQPRRRDGSTPDSLFFRVILLRSGNLWFREETPYKD
ncbi:hypothetical protein [Ralstonia phage RP31]|uniref:Uncharacterized protein n=2 Tax=Ripduovirus RP12 TaxID=2560700 RepID=A0A1L7N126_9CAUD|nr:hypothetical protein FDH28_gp219 [Ralstonia phage RP12]BAW19176.1 hypothetical protein [Ralstonia phage RP12]BAW19462.1 hypothetical protein [Ralstonia phage RP31]